MKSFRPVRPFKDFPPFNPIPFDPRSSTFIPQRYIHDELVDSISVRKIQLIGTKVYRSSNQSISNDTETKLSFNTEVFDEGEFWNSGTADRITFPYDGVYVFATYAEFAADATNRRRIDLLLNGAADMQQNYAAIGGGAGTQMFLSAPMRRTAGDYIEVRVWQNSGSSLNVAGGEANNFISAIFIGPI